jgi:hypothetical protein
MLLRSTESMSAMLIRPTMLVGSHRDYHQQNCNDVMHTHICFVVSIALCGAYLCEKVEEVCVAVKQK